MEREEDVMGFQANQEAYMATNSLQEEGNTFQIDPYSSSVSASNNAGGGGGGFQSINQDFSPTSHNGGGGGGGGFRSINQDFSPATTHQYNTYISPDSMHFPCFSPPPLDPCSSSSMPLYDAFPYPDLALNQPHMSHGNSPMVIGRDYTGGLLSMAMADPIQGWAASITRAARSKRRIARRMSFASKFSNFGRSPSSSSSSSSSGVYWPSPSSSGGRTGRMACVYLQGPNVLTQFENKRLKFVLQKELRNSDVSSLGRIVLPKRDAEAHLPYLTVKEGIQFKVTDLVSANEWHMRYRYWPNNKSRMYVLENTGEFVKVHDLRCGDFVILYQDENNETFIYPRKARPVTASSESVRPHSIRPQSPVARADGEATRQGRGRGKGRGRGSGEASATTATTTGEPKEVNDLGTGVVGGFFEEDDPYGFGIEPTTLILDDDYDFSSLERLPSFDECDLSLYESLLDMFQDDPKGGDAPGGVKEGTKREDMAQDSSREGAQ
ncbi:hypothetical protein AMTRI_Chr02g258140 [Amborella trichopoda]